MNRKDRKLIVATGPSGAGLPDIISDLLSERTDLDTVTPITARKPKEGETDGVPFYFYDLEGWNDLKSKGDLLESTELAGNDYGTSRRLVEEKLSSGKHVLLAVEPERAAQVKQNMPEAVCVYLEPADPAALRSIYQANARNAFELTARLELAAEQRTKSGFCDFHVDTENPQEALSELNRLIDRL